MNKIEALLSLIELAADPDLEDLDQVDHVGDLGSFEFEGRGYDYLFLCSEEFGENEDKRIESLVIVPGQGFVVLTVDSNDNLSRVNWVTEDEDTPENLELYNDDHILGKLGYDEIVEHVSEALKRFVFGDRDPNKVLGELAAQG